MSEEDFQPIAPLQLDAVELLDIPTDELLIETPASEIPTFDPFLPRYANDDLFCRVTIPLREQVMMKVIRNRDASLPLYDLYLERDETYLLHAKKHLGSQTYTIYTDRQADKYLGKVTCNFIGTVFHIYDDCDRVISVVLYKPNILGFKGPRCMTILLPKTGRDGKQILPSKDLYELYKENPKEVIVISNKTPLWNEETNSYVLNFNGRVTVASVKNFQLTPTKDLDYILLQFGRVSAEIFTLDCKYPLTIIQSFGIALTSFESKLACE